jgi:hypothetical protein
MEGGGKHTGIEVHLKEIPFPVRLFKLVATDGSMGWLITNEFDETVTAHVAQEANDVRWQLEEWHRGFKQLIGSEKGQCHKARSQRSHLACCYHAWISSNSMLSVSDTLCIMHILHCFRPIYGLSCFIPSFAGAK